MDANLSSAHKILVLNTLAFTICFACWTLNGVLVTYLVDNNIFNPNSAIEKKEYFSILISNCVAVEKNKR